MTKVLPAALAIGAVAMVSCLPAAADDQPTVIREQLNIRYPSVLIDVGAAAPAALRDEPGGKVHPVQEVPRTDLDGPGDKPVRLITATLEPNQSLRLAKADAPSDLKPLQVKDGVIANGPFCLRLPAAPAGGGELPGPVAGMKIKDGPWFGASRMTGAPAGATMAVKVESGGPVCIQWRVSYRWDGGGLDCLYRWAAGSDTIMAAERGLGDSPAAIEWMPFDSRPAKGWCWGGGEMTGNMRPIVQRHQSPTADTAPARVLMDRIGHISYSNQWTLAWAGFTREDSNDFVSLFSAFGGRWERRGWQALEIWQDRQAGMFVRQPVMKGVRFYGIVLSDNALSQIRTARGRCLPCLRKAVWSDWNMDKIRSWVLDEPVEKPDLHLLRGDELDGFRQKLAKDKDVTDALDAYWQAHAPKDERLHFAAALWKDDANAMKACAQRLAAWARREFSGDLPFQGHETIYFSIGRQVKAMVFDLDVMWHKALISEADYRAIRKTLLLLAYTGTDSDYRVYADFWPHLENPDEGIEQALKRDMGTTPCPPNFAAEIICSVGIIAELYPSHPMSARWRKWAMDTFDTYMNTFYEPDGTYHEGVNYHETIFNGSLCYFYPLYVKGVRNYFDNPRIKGSFRHMVQIQMPMLSDSLTPGDKMGPKGFFLWAGWQMPRRAPMPANGNSGANGEEQNPQGELALGAAIYRASDPNLAGELMNAWRTSGKNTLDQYHPLLTVLTLDPGIASIEPPCQSAWRKSLGVVSRARTADGEPVYCLFRAGRATHHMCFDQGGLHLAAYDSVLLGDPGYFYKDPNGRQIVGVATWLHSTLTYAPNKNWASGYTGLEEAPEPARVEINNAFDWVVHRITNTKFRDFEVKGFTYDQIDAPPTVHVRHYLFVKPDYFVIWDTFEKASAPATFWLHPRLELKDEGGGFYRAGQVGQPHLRVQLLLPEKPEVVENATMGPLWSFGARNRTGQPFLAVLVPQKEERNLTAAFDAAKGSLTVKGKGVDDIIELPPADSADALPRITRGSAGR